MIGLVPRRRASAEAAQRLLWFVVPAFLGCLVVAYLNVYLVMARRSRPATDPWPESCCQWGSVWPT